MKLHKRLFFLFQAITIGLAIAFLILLWKPELLNRGKQVVQFIESETPVISKGLSFNGPLSYADAVEIAAPAVVNVYTTKVVVQQDIPFLSDPFFRRFFEENFGIEPRRRKETSLGSGVIVNDQGYILTNNHVIEGAEAIQVSLRDGRNAKAEVVGTDPETDLAVLKIELEALPAIIIGKSENLRIGDVVLAIGNPFGVGQTVTQGIVSATGRTELGISTFENFIQTDAAINPGNSGGALITARGELIGINSAIFTRSGGSQGIGFAIPVSLAKGVMQQIIEHGHVRRGWLGIEIQEITPELAESFGLEDHKGIIIAGVLRSGPAERAGLKPGDIILQINNKPVDSARMALDAITQTRPGDKIHVDGIRDGKPFQLKAEVAERPAFNEAR